MEIEFTNLKECLEDYGKAVVEAYKNNLKGISSGDLINNMTYEVHIGNETSYSISLNLESYWQHIEYGRKIGTFPDIGAIKHWVEVKNIAPRPYNGRLPTTEQLVYLISRKIARDGIPARPILANTVGQVETDFRAKLEAAISKDISQDYSDTMSETAIFSGGKYVQVKSRIIAD